MRINDCLQTKRPTEIQHFKEPAAKPEQILLEFQPRNQKYAKDENVEEALLDEKWRESGIEHVEQEEDRGVWANKLEFFLAIVGYTVGISSVWRFPIICR